MPVYINGFDQQKFLILVLKLLVDKKIATDDELRSILNQCTKEKENEAGGITFQA